MSDDDLIFIARAINVLRKNEGSSVLILCDNPDFNDGPNNAIEVSDDWTNWKPRRFNGNTLRGALEVAICSSGLSLTIFTRQLGTGGNHDDRRR